MEKRFTEGEWVIDKQRDTVCIDILCNDEVVATCWDDYDCVDQLRANAKLIAAVPYMFAALEQFVNDFEGDYIIDGVIVDNPSILLMTNYELAKQAIKKATE